ncbi:putative Platelet-activating factor acetylhydrolase, plasma/intracellular isoform II [Streptomyces viridochromogenes Tue57]|uniref:Putative Platelet-activating factor acetylhydrolase, plasma/intracellular isoform II n=1 Tax=Streptomyces viridochromogenes Tue57 TaxID=1160705 RepID=L8PCC2_STRVR|nr:putative Platelet-activating factor acetylhydrolase, plasma/intracellular isoform II [Streptomyces viridochromogenes Tue57]
MSAVLVLGPALTLPVVAAGAASAASVSSSTAAESPQLPRPTGPHAVGRDTLHLVDTDRPDPWVPSAGARQLMVSMYYPARRGTGGPTAPYMTTEEARHLLELRVPDATVPPEAISGVRTWAHTDARPLHGRFPLVVLSPGFTFPRATLTGLAEDLASRGYVVALVDHTYENAGTTFPDGQTLPCAVCDTPPSAGGSTVAESRAEDVSFVLDRLTGRHPAWRHARVIDAKRIGMAGHSIGGNAALTTMAADARVRAGVNMDGTFFAQVPPAGLDGRPFLMVGAENRPPRDTSWDEAWARLDGWKGWLSFAGTDHGSFTDVPLLAELVGIPDTATMPYLRSQVLTRAYVAAFFDQHLKGVPQPLLDGPSPANPEVTVRLP